jgi:rhodanese-related sulfurtransferase
MNALTKTLVLLLVLATSSAWAAGTITAQQLSEKVESGKAPLIIDVRTEEEYLAGHVPGARLIPHDQIGDYLDTLSTHKDERIVVYCRSGNRAKQAIEKLEEAGFEHIIELEGSFQAWNDGERRVEP